MVGWPSGHQYDRGGTSSSSPGPSPASFVGRIDVICFTHNTTSPDYSSAPARFQYITATRTRTRFSWLGNKDEEGARNFNRVLLISLSKVRTVRMF